MKARGRNLQTILSSNVYSPQSLMGKLAISFKKDIVLFEHLAPEHCLNFSVRAFCNLAMPEISIVLRSMITKSGLQAFAIQLLLFYNVVQFRLWD